MAQTMRATGMQRWLAWSLVGIAILAFAANIYLELQGCNTLINPNQPAPATAYGIMMLPINAIAVSLLGALIVRFHPGNRIGWVFLFYGLGFPIGLLGESYGSCSILNDYSWVGTNQSLWLINFADFTTIGLILFFWLFPTGSFHSSTWKKLGISLLIITILTSITDYFWPHQLGEFIALEGITIANPISLPIDPSPAATEFVSQAKDLSGLIFALTGIASIVVRWRQSDGIIRQQMKWMTYFLASAGTVFLLVELIGVVAFPQIFYGWFYLIELSIFWLGFPVILGFAIFRFRLYDIDLVIRRTIQYALVTGILALVYFGGIVTLQSILSPLTGSENSPVVTVITTLGIAALFNPLRIRVQDFIDRRFYRKKYDAEQTLERFAETARDEVDMEKISSELLGVIHETMQPESTSLWVKE